MIKKMILITMVGLAFMIPDNLFAQKPEQGTQQSGFSFSVTSGLMAGEFRDQLAVYEDKNKKIDSLNNNGDQFTFVAPIIDAGISYTFEDIGTTIFLGSVSSSTNTQSGISISQTLGNMGTLNGELIYEKEEVWENPFLTGVDREATDSIQEGFSVSYENILNTGFQVEYIYNEIDVDNDYIGQLYSALKRDGKIDSVNLGWALPISENSTLVPIYNYSKASLDGKANSFKDQSGGLSYIFEKTDIAIEITGLTGEVEYDAAHPIFQKTREDKTFAIEASFTLSNFFGVEGLSANFGGAYAEQNSNINFFDANVAMVNTGVTYAF